MLSTLECPTIGSLCFLHLNITVLCSSGHASQVTLFRDHTSFEQYLTNIIHTAAIRVKSYQSRLRLPRTVCTDLKIQNPWTFVAIAIVDVAGNMYYFGRIYACEYVNHADVKMLISVLAAGAAEARYQEGGNGSIEGTGLPIGATNAAVRNHLMHPCERYRGGSG